MLTAIKDAVNSSESLERTLARSWLLNGTDFGYVASLAGFDPDAIRRQIFLLRDRGWTKTDISVLR
ncbi:hypothetical protein [Shimia sagamensis]|nr:hypothetical protein [Shimia sagamensis]